jgi:hypothetical protein
LVFAVVGLVLCSGAVVYGWLLGLGGQRVVGGLALVAMTAWIVWWVKHSPKSRIRPNDGSGVT